MPYSWYQKNNLEHWSGTDQPENVDTNWSVPISYKFNPQGDLARDKIHNGLKFNLNLANLFLTGVQ